jgi:tRNA modification GTPase
MGAKDTVVALSSGKGKSAIAVIRLSGPDSFSCVESCLVPGSSFGKQPEKTVGLFTFVNPQTKRKIDHICATKYRGPHSFTGEDMVELFCHGSEIVVENILTALVDCGAAYAERGEFTRRAYCNGKFDLITAEAIHGIIESRSEQEHFSFIEAYFGSSRKRLQEWKNAIKDVLRDIEAIIEFPEEDDVLIQRKRRDQDGIAKIIKEMELDIKNKEDAKMIEKGIIIPIVGIPNAGKSSLFNLLLECDRSIVHWQEGTTRDSVSEEIQIGTEKIMLVDTAGLRKTKNQVELMGIGKTEELIRNSAMILWVTPADGPISAHEKTMLSSEAKQRIVCIMSKEDLGLAEEKKVFCSKENIPFISSCLFDKERREKLVSFIRDQVEKKIGAIEMPSVIRNKRQELAVCRLLQNLKDAQNNRKSGEEVYSRFLQRALEDIGQIIGKTTSDEILNRIFSEFCIGK